jgi:tRNA A-37 threonylcarbamoyl transferase component Bud32
MVDIDKLVTNYKIFVDTCSFMHEKASDFFERHLSTSLDRTKSSNSDTGAKLIIPLKIGNELVKLQKSTDKSTQKSAIRATKILNEYVKIGYAAVYGDQDDSFADNLFLTIFTRFRLKYNVLLITQDSKLAQDILALRDSRSVKVEKGVTAFRINDSGNLEEWKKWKKSDDDNSPELVFTPSSSFDSPITATQILPVSVIPNLNDEVTSKRLGTLKLVKEIGKGGEGSIFTTESKLICKIYKKERLTDLVLKKLELMVSKEVNISGVCWPREIVFNANGEFFGYAMEQARGKAIQRAMFVKPLLEQNFPEWNRKSLVDLAITILRKIRALNERNIIIGDINPLNILVHSSQEVYFVDTDSYQIEDFPCPVGTVNFTAPEIQGQHFAKFLRTPEHENFAIATLLFMILMPGKSPYSQQGGGYPREKIKRQDFSYPLGTQSNRKAPQGPWRFIWSHFPFQTKEAFYNNFKENNRKTAKEWLSIMWAYAKLLQRGYVSNEIFPTGLKPYTPKEGDDGKTDEELICSECGEPFTFSVGEQRYFEEKDFEAPKRGPCCRRSRAKV